MAATVDVLSEGRLELGLGWGSVERELETYGIGAGPPKARAARMRETIEVLDLMFTGELFDHDGAVELRGAIGRPRPVQQPRPPLHIGGAGPTLTMPLVRDHADWWNCPTYAVDRLDELRALAGDARVSVQHPVGLARGAADREETVAMSRRRFGGWGGLIAGTSTEVGDALAAEAASGVEGFVIQLTDFGAPETIAQFMAEVAPAVSAVS
jgi:alkanesulfonate monooxygenase SsuD/methylene tetrahydromethanopterin reductase-like flavin-dependent oxidoreductase (luciferase family)